MSKTNRDQSIVVCCNLSKQIKIVTYKNNQKYKN